MKREADGEETMSSPVKRRRNLDDPELRILIPSKAAGSIIGKCGHNITRLRTEYNASVTVPDCPGPERILTICADLETILRVVENVIPNIEDVSSRHGDNTSRSRDNEVDLRLLVHQSQAGCIIGKAGFKIKELREVGAGTTLSQASIDPDSGGVEEKTGARIKIFSNCCPQSTDRVCQISGRPSTCVDSIREIMDLLKTSPVKGLSSPYDPHNYDDYFAHEYGGYGEQDKAGRGGGMRGMPGGPPPPMGGRGGGGGRYPAGPRGRGGMGDVWSGDDMDMFSRNAPPPPGGGMGPPRGVGGYGGRAGVGGGSGYRVPPPPPPNGLLMGDSNMGPGSSMLAPKTTTQVTIPKELAGAIIGKGGARIRKIRADSGAGITIDEALVGSNDRIITITGTTSQIQMAQYLLQQSCQAGMDPSSNYP